VQLQYPGVVIAFEKMLVAGCLPVAAAVQTWGMVAGVGMSSSCFFLSALLCGLYYLFALPLPSSFHLGGRGRAAMGESVCACVCGCGWVMGGIRVEPDWRQEAIAGLAGWRPGPGHLVLALPCLG